MKGIVLFIVVPLMVIGLSALVASSAAALEAVWLVDGVKPAMKDTYVAQGGGQSFTYEEFMGFKIKVKVFCNMAQFGFIAGNKTESNAKLDETTEVLNINELLPLECHFIEEGPCSKATSPVVSAANLPWATEIVLSGAKYRDRVKRVGGTANPGWKLACSVLGVEVSETCTSASIEPELTNFVANNAVDVIYNKTLEPNYVCSGSGKASMSIEGNIEMKLGPGEVLAVSEG